MTVPSFSTAAEVVAASDLRALVRRVIGEHPVTKSE